MITLHSLKLHLMDSGAQTWLVLTVCMAVFLAAILALKWIDKKQGGK